jgi:hypothetical protein
MKLIDFLTPVFEAWTISLSKVATDAAIKPERYASWSCDFPLISGSFRDAGGRRPISACSLRMFACGPPIVYWRDARRVSMLRHLA